MLALLCLAPGCCGNRAAQPDIPIVVSAEYPGASATEVEAAVVCPLEVALLSTPGLRQLESTSVEGEGHVVLWFEEPSEDGGRTLLVLNQIADVDAQLPPDASIASVWSGAAAERAPLEFAVSGLDGMAPDIVWVDALVRELLRTPGVDRCLVAGAREPRIEVAVDPARAAVFGIDLAAVEGALGASVLVGGLPSVQEVEDLVLSADGPIFLRDIANIHVSWDATRTRAELDGRPVALVSPVLREGEDAEAALAALREAVGVTARSWPEGVEVVELVRADSAVEMKVRGLGGDEMTLASVEPLRESAREMGAARELLTLGVRREGALAGMDSPGLVTLAWAWDEEPPANARASFNDIARSTPELGLTRLVIAGDRTVRVVMGGPEHAALDRPADDLANHLASLDGVQGVWDDRGVTQPTVEVHLQRDKLARFGVTIASAANALRAARYGVEAGHVLDGEQRIPVVLRWGRVEPELDQLADLPLPLPEAGRGTVPLALLADITLVAHSSALHRVDAQPAVTLEVVVDADREKALRKSILTELPTDLPDGVTVQLIPR